MVHSFLTRFSLACTAVLYLHIQCLRSLKKFGVRVLVKAEFYSIHFSLFTRLLFPDREELVDELLHHSGVDPSLRAHEVTLDEFDKLCGAFIDITNEHQLEPLPLRVRRPGHVVFS